jgi:hypothetical protein
MDVPLRDNIRTLRRPDGAGPSPTRRLCANWPAEIRAGGVRIACTVLDVSSAGAHLRVDCVPPPSERIWLLVENVGPVAAQIAWQKRDRMGICFMKEQEWVSRLCKTRFDPSAWLNSDS